MTGRRDEAGVVAIIVALSISGFLVGFAALAVDMGSAYARQADIQSLAEKLAMAGAAGLPDTGQALIDLNEARGQFCTDDDLPGVCDAGASWMQDGDLDNGEVRFYDDRGQEGMFAELSPPAGLDTDDFLAYGATTASGIRVILPPSRVEFGLGSAIGFDGVNVTRAATARIGTPLGLGILPFALTQTDLDVGQFCVKDTTVTGDGLTPDPVPAGTQIRADPDQYPRVFDPEIQGDTGPKDLHFSLQPLPMPLLPLNPPPSFAKWPKYTDVVWHTTNSTLAGQVAESDKDRDGLVPPRYNSWTVTVPEAPERTTIYVWATGQYQASENDPTVPFLSQPSQVVFTGGVAPRDDLCDKPAAKLRGYVDLARTDRGGLTANVRTGPQAKLYDTTTNLGESLLRSTVDCAAGAIVSSSACISQRIAPRTPFMDRVRNGLLGSGGQSGRLQGNCGMNTRPGRPGVDPSQLIDGGNAFLLNSGSPGLLRQRIVFKGQDAADGYEGMVSSRALRCPRLAVVPVVKPLSVAGIVGGQEIVKFVYVWIDEAGSPASQRGLTFVSGGRLSSVRGYVIQPKFLPELVAGSPLVGPYMGTDMPKQVVLVRDLGSDDT